MLALSATASTQAMHSNNGGCGANDTETAETAFGCDPKFCQWGSSHRCGEKSCVTEQNSDAFCCANEVIRAADHVLAKVACGCIALIRSTRCLLLISSPSSRRRGAGSRTATALGIHVCLRLTETYTKRMVFRGQDLWRKHPIFRWKIVDALPGLREGMPS